LGIEAVAHVERQRQPLSEAQHRRDHLILRGARRVGLKGRVKLNNECHHRKNDEQSGQSRFKGILAHAHQHILANDSISGVLSFGA
jgi:hypothetical protein